MSNGIPPQRPAGGGLGVGLAILSGLAAVGAAAAVAGSKKRRAPAPLGRPKKPCGCGR